MALEAFHSLHQALSSGSHAQLEHQLSTIVGQGIRNDELGAALKLALALKPTSTSLILDLDDGMINDDGQCICEALGMVKTHGRLQFMQIRMDTFINEGGAHDKVLRALPQVLEENQVLKTLWIQGPGLYNIGESTWQGIARALKSNRSLIDFKITIQSHDVYNEGLGVEALREFAQAIRANPSLKKLAIICDPLEVDEQTSVALADAIKMNSTLRHVCLRHCCMIPYPCGGPTHDQTKLNQEMRFAEVISLAIQSNMFLLHFDCPLFTWKVSAAVELLRTYVSCCDDAIERNQMAHALLGVARFCQDRRFKDLKDVRIRVMVFSFFLPSVSKLSLLDFLDCEVW